MNDLNWKDFIYAELTEKYRSAAKVCARIYYEYHDSPAEFCSLYDRQDLEDMCRRAEGMEEAAVRSMVDDFYTDAYKSRRAKVTAGLTMR